MWTIKQIFDGEYGCEERSEKDYGKVSVTLRSKNGEEKYFRISDTWLIKKGLEEGSIWPYEFYGWEQAMDVKAVLKTYPGIENPLDLYDALSKIWCAETCAERMRKNWTNKNPTLGQCSISAFLAQDIFGGEVYGMLRKGGNYHCYNVIDHKIFDLTSEQFGEEVLVYQDNPVQSREVHFAKEEKKGRYEFLKSLLKQYCEK